MVGYNVRYTTAQDRLAVRHCSSTIADGNPIEHVARAYMLIYKGHSWNDRNALAGTPQGVPASVRLILLGELGAGEHATGGAVAPLLLHLVVPGSDVLVILAAVD